MARHASGVYLRSQAGREGREVRVFGRDRKQLGQASLLALDSTSLRLSGIVPPPPVGAAVRVAITLPGRYIEFEVPAVVAWFDGAEIGLKMPYLTARQAYGVALAIDLIDVTDPQRGKARSSR